MASVADPVTGTTSYTYQPTGERATVTLPGGGTWNYTYASRSNAGSDWSLLPKDDPGSATLNPWTITDDQGRVLNVEPATTGQPIGEQANQVFDTNANLVSYISSTYEDEGALVGGAPFALDDVRGTMAHVVQTFWWRTPNGQGGYNPWMNRPLSASDYTYDANGMRLTNTLTQPVTGAGGGPQYTGGSPQVDQYGDVTNEITSTRTETYGYDDLSRLKTVAYGDGQTQGYTFDAMGNRLSRTDSANGNTSYAFDAANRLTATTGTGASTYSNDADGNTLTGGNRTNTWDSQNRLVSCAYTSGGVNYADSYKYGSDGLRRQGTVNGTVTNYAYDGQSMVREMKLNGQGTLIPTATYLTGPRGPEYRRDDTQTEPDGQGHTFGKTRWYIYDGLGSVVGEVDPLGNLTCQDAYDVYGQMRGRNGTATTKHGFVGGLGHLSEAETGLVYMKARYYDPTTGRFVSEDPKQAGNNWFEYCNANPACKVDQSGKDPSDPNWWESFGQSMEEWGAGLITAGMGICYRGCAILRVGQWMQAFGIAGGPLSAAALNGPAAEMQFQGGLSIIGGLLTIIAGAEEVQAGYYIENNPDEAAATYTSFMSKM